jgi:hypothetical protein
LFSLFLFRATSDYIHWCCIQRSRSIPSSCIVLPSVFIDTTLSNILFSLHRCRSAAGDCGKAKSHNSKWLANVGRRSWASLREIIFAQLNSSSFQSNASIKRTIIDLCNNKSTTDCDRGNLL